MFSLVTILHRDISRRALLDAIRVKQVAWPYPKEKQEKWIKDNIQNNDIHCFLKEGNKTIAYMNLVDEEVILDNSPYKIWGVGNVCSAVRGKGYGNALMQKVNEYINNNHRVGMLLCHDSLVPFYSKHGWEEVENVQLPVYGKEIHVMFYNCSNTPHIVKYKGRNF